MEHHNNHHFELHKSLHDKMSKLYIYQALLTFAKSLIGIFIPVFLYKSGYSLTSIVIYSIGISLTYLILIPISVKIIKKIGFKYTILLSTPIYLLHIAFVNYVAQSIIFFHLCWITFGIYVSLFWPAFHSEIAVSGSSKHRSSQMGTLQIISTLFGTIAPIIGGFMLDFTGYWSLFMLASTLIFVGIIPLLISKDTKLKNYNFEYKNYIKLIKNNKYKNSKKAFSFEGFNAFLIILIWPVIIFNLLDQSFFKLGTLLSLISLLCVIVILYIKTYIDKNNKNKSLKYITRFTALSWFFKSIILFFSLFALYIIESISKLAQNIFNLIYASIFYNNAKKMGYMDYIILRELYLHISKITFGIMMIIIFSIFGENLNTLCAIAFSGVFISLGLGNMKEK